MPYQVAYDVLEDGYHFGFAWIGVPIGVLILVMAALRPRKAARRLTWYPPYYGSPLVGVVAGGLCATVFAAVIGVSLWDQHACRQDALRGGCPTVEGKVTRLQKLKSRTEFEVAGVPLQYHRRSAGFRGKFTNPDFPIALMNDGLPVRILYCGENILRIEYLPP